MRSNVIGMLSGQSGGWLGILTGSSVGNQRGALFQSLVSGTDSQTTALGMRAYERASWVAGKLPFWKRKEPLDLLLMGRCHALAEASCY